MFCIEEYQNKHLSDLFLLENCFPKEDPLLNRSPSFWSAARKLKHLGTWGLLQTCDLHLFCPLKIYCSEIALVLVAPDELHLSS